MTPEPIKRKIADNPLARQAVTQDPVHNGRDELHLDGMCYNARSVEGLLEQTFDRIHFDEAWYAYARFNLMYRDRYAMRVRRKITRRTDRRSSPRSRPTSY
jgi:arginine decarboxylase